MKKISSLILALVAFIAVFAGAPSEKAFAESESLTSAKSMCVMETHSGRILYSKNMDEKLPEASLTKIITAIVAIENNPDLEKVVTIPKEAVGVEGSSIYLTLGEHLTIRELLYGLMLRSGNDSAVALAVATSGSVDAFIDLANEFCARVGAVNTHLVTPHGLHDDEHYTTARDLAVITSYALKNKTFAEIVGSKYAKINNESKGGKRDLKNKNKLLFNMPGANGVKTGYTQRAGRCFVGSAIKDDMEVVCVLLNCNPMFEDCEKLLNQAFAEYSMVDFVTPYQNMGSVNVANSDKLSVKTFVRDGFSYPLTIKEQTQIHIETDLPQTITAPIKSGQAVGEYKISLANDLIFSEKIYTIESAEANDYLTKLNKIIEGLA